MRREFSRRFHAKGKLTAAPQAIIDDILRGAKS